MAANDANAFVPMSGDEFHSTFGNKPKQANAQAPASTAAFQPMSAGEFASSFLPSDDKSNTGLDRVSISPDTDTNPIPRPIRLGEAGLEMAGMGLGGAAGMALGGGPETPIGYTGAVMGGTGGLTTAQNINKKINEKLGYEKPAPFGSQQTPKSVMSNAAAVAGGELISPAVSSVGEAAGARLIGKKALQDVAGKAMDEVNPDEIAASKEHVTDLHADAEAAANEAVNKARREMLEEGKARHGFSREEAKNEAIMGGLGRTPEQTRAARLAEPELAQGVKGPTALPGDAATQRRSAFFDAVYGPSSRNAERAGEKFEDLFGPHVNEDVEGAPLATTVSNEQAWAAEHGQTYSPGVNKLFGEVNELTSPETVGANRLGISPKDWKNLSHAEQQALLNPKVSSATESFRPGSAARPGQPPVGEPAEPRGGPGEPPATPNTGPENATVDKPAIKYNGKVYPGEYGETHDQIIKRIRRTEDSLIVASKAEHGFIDDSGQYVDRPTAREEIKAKTGVDVGPGSPTSDQLGVEEGQPNTPHTKPQAQPVAPGVKTGPLDNGPKTPAATAPVKVGKLLGLRSRIGEMMHGADGPDRAALSALRDQIDDQLGASDIPGAKQLRAQYRALKTDFGQDFYRALGKVSDPADAGAILFDTPQRMMQLAKATTPAEKTVLRDTMADYLLKMGPGGEFPNINKMTPEWAEGMKALGFKGDIANPGSWVYLSKVVPKFQDLVTSSPTAAAKFNAAMNAERTTAMRVQERTLIKGATDEAKRMGESGKPILEAIKQARTSADKAKVAIDQFQLLSPQSARQAVGARAIQNYVPKGGWMAYMQRRAMMYIILGAAFAGGGGHMGASFAERGAALGAVAIPYELSRGAYFAMKRSPEAATAFVKAMENPGAPSALRRIANSVVNAGVAEALSASGLTDKAAGMFGEKPRGTSALGLIPKLPVQPMPAKASRAVPDNIPKVKPPVTMSNTPFRKALFEARLQGSTKTAAKGEMEGFKNSQYRNALVQGIRNAKSPQEAQQLAESMYVRGLVDADGIRKANSDAQNLPLADELKRSSTASILAGYSQAGETEKDIVDHEIVRRYEDSPDSFKSASVSRYKPLVLRILTEHDKAENDLKVAAS